MEPTNRPSLLERIYSWENLLNAYHEAASEKWYRDKAKDTSSCSSPVVFLPERDTWTWQGGHYEK